MPLFKAVKRPVIKAATSAGAEISPLRPWFVPKTPPCVSHCPNGSDARGWLAIIAQAEAYGRTPEQACQIAWEKIVERNPFPAVCGRVCPHPCEDACSRKDKDGAVAINAMERFVGDFGIARHLKLSMLGEERHLEKVAVVGAGPAGLSCAYQLARRGYTVTVFEALNQAGGMLRYGIPHYRLPREILDAEIQRILDLGVELKCNFVVGRDISLGQLRQEYRAVFVGIGAHKGLKLGIPGDDAPSVWTGTEFLNRLDSGGEVRVGGKVLVIGGGDTAIDAARVCRRLGAEVTLVYRRTCAEMPAIKSEIEGAREEGARIEFLAAPVEILLRDGAAVGARCIRMELGTPDASGRPRPVPKPGSEFDLKATAIIAAIGQEPELEGFDRLRSGREWIKIDEWGATSVEGVYAGGDDVELGLASVAISQGRLAAEAIHGYLRGKQPVRRMLPPDMSRKRLKLDWYKPAARHERRRIPFERRTIEAEVESGLTESQAIDESKRCMSCGMCMDCENCWMYCTDNCFVRLPKGEHYSVKLELCNGCKKCADACPTGHIEMI